MSFRFAFISSMGSDPWGGSEELWSQAALQLAAAGHPVAALVTHWPQPHPRVINLANQGVKIAFHSSRSRNLMSRAWRRCVRGRHSRWLRDQKPDLAVVSQGGVKDGLSWMKLCREAGLPYVSVVQCNAELWWPEDGIVGEMAALYRDANKVFCISRPNLKMLEHQIGENLPNAAIVWNPNNLSIAEPVPWPATNQVWKMACVGRLEPGPKGQDVLFQVLAQPRWRERPVELNLYGGGSCEQGLRRLAGHLGLSRVHFRGHVPDVRKIWEENHLLVLPSRYEGIPMVVMEAMWCGRPAVATNVGRVDEMCVDGETGFVVSAPAVDLLDQALERAWDRRDDWQKMGNAARARAGHLIPADPVGEFCRQLLDCATLRANAPRHV